MDVFAGSPATGVDASEPRGCGGWRACDRLGVARVRGPSWMDEGDVL